MEQPRRRLSAVWFADIVSYSELSSRDEPAALRLVSTLQTLARAIVERDFDGRIVKFIGDAVLAEFSSTESAVRAAVALQEQYAAGAEGHGASSRLRVGVHLGEVTPTPDGDLYGDGINTAARLQHEAAPGQVIVSEDVWRQLRQRPEFRFNPLGAVELRGITAHVEIFDVLFGARAALSPLPAVRAGAARRRWPVGAAAAVIVLGVAVASMMSRRPRELQTPPPAANVQMPRAAERPPVLPPTPSAPVPAEPAPGVAPVPVPAAANPGGAVEPTRPLAAEDAGAGRAAPARDANAPGRIALAEAAVRGLIDDFSAALSSDDAGSALRQLFVGEPGPAEKRLFAGFRQQFGADVQVRTARIEPRGVQGEALDLRFVVFASSSTRSQTPLAFDARAVRTPGGLRFVQVARALPQRASRPSAPR
jgi:class 3 adenylate cyclase